MDNLIYSATPLRAFLGSIFLITFLLILGGIGSLSAIFRRKERAGSRIAMGCSAIVLLLASVAMGINFLLTLQTGDRTVVVHVNDKNIVESNCGDNSNSTCTSYVLETNAGTKFYDFTVASETYEKVNTESCYRFTYYPAQSLFGKYFQERDISNSYETASTITKIEKVSCP